MITTLKLPCLILLALLATVGIQSCATNDKAAYINYEGYHVPNPHKHLVLTNVYSYQQSTNYTCGPAVVMTLLQHYGKLSMSDMNRDTEMRIAKEMNTTMSGTSQDEMVAWLRKNGFSVQSGQNVSLDMLINNINRGIPTIIAWNDLSEHAMLVVGYNSEGASPAGDHDVIFTADPASGGSIENAGNTTRGIDSLTPNQLELNEVNANFFNPSHSAIGMYITAVPN
ncbi:MAG: C39 family peptidase [Pseudomonadota bacterium]